ncbi:mitochondrial assembly of ribosomal large subunit protein 1 [Hoplias malabaricus]|uniref:mitochondrial assembly of ribosomal large subunit protein 1 n=1 Tax=Hoplias malabaricus TaxID=27720 RepID=UPI003462C8C8
MNVVRRSSCVLSGLFRRFRAVYPPENQRTLTAGTAALIQTQHGRVSGFTDFKTLHSHTDTDRGGEGGTAGYPSVSQEQKQHEPITFNLDVMVSLLRQENAEDICVIKVPEELKYSDYFIVVSGSSSRHLKAMALYAIKVYKFMKRDCDPHVHLEGKDAEDWMCIDFGSMVVHFMLPETRAVYELEKLWTLRSFDEQFSRIPAQSLPEDFIYDAEIE